MELRFPPIGYRFRWVSTHAWRDAHNKTFEVTGYKKEMLWAVCTGDGGNHNVHLSHFRINGGPSEEPVDDPNFYINHDFESAARRHRDEIFREMFREKKRKLF